MLDLYKISSQINNADIERGQTSCLNSKTKSVCAIALSIPVGYLDAVVRGEVVSIPEKQQFCPKCWTPGSEPDTTWLIHRAKYCLLCGTKLRSFRNEDLLTSRFSA